jgi:hypothetical protein
MADARSDSVAVRLKDGQMLIAGGLVGSSETIARGELYATSLAPCMRLAQGQPPPCWPMDASLSRAAGPSGDRTATAETYDPVRRTFKSIPSLDAPQGSAVGAVLPDGRVLIAGGESTSGAVLKSAEVFDPSREQFEPTGAMAVPCTTAAAAPLPDGRILIVGGSDGSRALSPAEIYDPSAGRFQPAGAMSSVREKLGAVTLADGRVLVAGGATDGTADNAGLHGDLRSGQRALLSWPGHGGRPLQVR